MELEKWSGKLQLDRANLGWFCLSESVQSTTSLEAQEEGNWGALKDIIASVAYWTIIFYLCNEWSTDAFSKISLLTYGLQTSAFHNSICFSQPYNLTPLGKLVYSSINSNPTLRG